MNGAELRSLTFSFRAARAVMAAVETGVVDALVAAPLTAEAVAETCGLSPRGARALLEALVSLELVEATGSGYAATPVLGETLAEDAPESRRHVVLHDLWHWGLFARLEESLRSGKPLTDRSRDPFFSDPAVLVRFFPNLAEAMTETSRDEIRRWAERVELAQGARLLDLGGGAGAFALAVARAHPDLQVTLMDLPPVAQRAEAAVRDAGMEDRVHVIAADFSAAPLDPSGDGFDRVLLARVLMGLDDEAAVALLERVREVLRPGGRVDLLELRRRARVGALLDLDMLLLTGGAVRSAVELAVLCERAGLWLDGQSRLGDEWVHFDVGPKI